ncbi:MAG: P-type conjugative transfer protein TrbL [Deltaproteobacteria bacterium]|nr:P-type conjugative transfer protein TrbL [Deltaproteobacteria bacterium]
MTNIETMTDAYLANMEKVAKELFRITLILELALFGINIALKRNQLNDVIAQFMTILIFAGLIAAIISNYPTWSKNIVNGLEHIGTSVGAPRIDNFHRPYSGMSEVVKVLLEKAEDLSWQEMVQAFFLMITAAIVFCSFALIIGLILIIKAEFYILSVACLLLIGLGGSKIFKEYAINAMKYIFSVGLKLFIMQVILDLGLKSLQSADRVQYFTNHGIVNGDLVVLIAQSALLLLLSWVLPNTIAGVLQGAQVSGGNPIGNMAMAAGREAVGGIASAARGGSRGALSAASDNVTAFKTAGLQGTTGLERFRQARANIAEAKSQAGMNPNTVSGQLRAQYSKAVEHNKAESQMTTEPPAGQAPDQADPAETAANPAGQAAPASTAKDSPASPATAPETGQAAQVSTAKGSPASPAMAPEAGQAAPASTAKGSPASPARAPETGRAAPASTAKDTTASPATAPETGQATQDTQSGPVQCPVPLSSPTGRPKADKTWKESSRSGESPDPASRKVSLERKTPKIKKLKIIIK